MKKLIIPLVFFSLIFLLSCHQKYGDINGVVTKTNGDPINGALVVLSNKGQSTLTYQELQAIYENSDYSGDAQGGRRIKYTGANGYYEFNELLPGDYQIIVYKEGYYTGETTVMVEEELTTVQDFILIPENVSLNGTVYDENAEPIYEAKVEISESNELDEIGSILTDINGYYEFIELSPGDYFVKVTKENYLPGEALVTIEEGQSKTQNFRLLPDSAGNLPKPFAHYPFDGNANDYSGNNLHGTEYGVVLYENGVKNEAKKFLPTPNDIDFNYVIAPNSIPGSDFSVCFWASFDNLERHQSIIMLNKANQWNYSDFWIYTSDKRIAVLQDGLDLRTKNYEINTPLSEEFLQSEILSLETWYFVSVVYFLSEQMIKIYLNGIEYASYPNVTNVNNTTSNLLIGVCPDPNNYQGKYDYQHEGLLDELMVFKIALTDEQVVQLYSLK